MHALRLRAATRSVAPYVRRYATPASGPLSPKAPFSAPKEPSQDHQGTGANTVFPTQDHNESPEAASPPLIPTADSSHKSTTQVPASRTPVEKGEGRVSTSVSSEHLPGGGPSSLHADSHEHAGDASVGEGSENRGLGNFRPKAEVEGAAREAGSKVQDAASKAGDKLSEAASQAGSKVEEVKGKAGSKVEELKEKASDLASKASDKFEEVKSKVSGSVDQAKNQAGDAASSASDAVDGVKAKAQEAGQEAKQSAKELAQEVAKEGVKVAGGEALRRMGIPSVSAAMEALPKEEKFEYEDRQLNQAEQRGLYVLAGTVVGGYLLSRLFAPKTTAGPQVAHHDKH